MFIAYLSSIALLLGLLSHSSAFEKRAVSSASTTSCISDNCLNAVSSAYFTGVPIVLDMNLLSLPLVQGE